MCMKLISKITLETLCQDSKSDSFAELFSLEVKALPVSSDHFKWIIQINTEKHSFEMETFEGGLN